METLLYVALWVVVIWLTSHRLQAWKEAGEGGRPGLRWVPPVKDTDPVCGKIVTTDGAKPSVYDGNVYYFCSRECREIFEAAPSLYLSDGAKEGYGAGFQSAPIKIPSNEKSPAERKLNH